MQRAKLSIETAEIIRPTASTLPDQTSLDTIGVSIVCPERTPMENTPAWVETVLALSSKQKTLILGGIACAQEDAAVHNLELLRRLPARELKHVEGIGPGRLAILKAFGHYAERELSLEEVFASKLYSNPDLR